MDKREDDMFDSHKGVLFKRCHDGYHPTPHCPHCRLPMFIQMEHSHFHCYKCGFTSKITINELDETLREIARKNPDEDLEDNRNSTLAAG